MKSTQRRFQKRFVEWELGTIHYFFQVITNYFSQILFCFPLPKIISQTK